MIKHITKNSEAAEQDMIDWGQYNEIFGDNPDPHANKDRSQAGMADEPAGPNYFMAGGPQRTDEDSGRSVRR